VNATRRVWYAVVASRKFVKEVRNVIPFRGIFVSKKEQAKRGIASANRTTWKIARRKKRYESDEKASEGERAKAEVRKWKKSNA